MYLQLEKLQMYLTTDETSIIVGYVDHQCIIRKPFIAFGSCKNGTTGEALSANILTKLLKHELDISLLHGQGYDDAPAMAGCVSDVAARIQS